MLNKFLSFSSVNFTNFMSRNRIVFKCIMYSLNLGFYMWSHLLQIYNQYIEFLFSKVSIILALDFYLFYITFLLVYDVGLNYSSVLFSSFLSLQDCCISNVPFVTRIALAKNIWLNTKFTDQLSKKYVFYIAYLSSIILLMIILVITLPILEVAF